ncbi:metallophosphoesterase family protein [Lichenicola sp.]|uniref:metallophosphoesterase family protein n=1 Tax=Lichenicola sp. TaxID=2804529 RepID=UPI003B00FF74
MSDLCWMQIGDLHVTAEGDRCLADLREIVAVANTMFADGVDFVFLPGDNANEGAAAQYRLIRRSLDTLALPLRIIPGDHDFVPGNLDAYREALGAHDLPRAETIGGVRCVFLDIVSAGSGGPDFRLGAPQRTWLAQELAEADRLDLPTALFMHAFAADLRDAADELAALFAQHRVVAVSTGHTHYNEILNDGHAISVAVRSTGQVEEGPVGFAVTVVEAGAVAWRFRTLEHPSPFCIVTAPTDLRLLTAASEARASSVPPGHMEVRARAWSPHEIVHASCRIADGPLLAMTRQASHGTMSVWRAVVAVSPGHVGVTVLVEDAVGRTDEDTVNAWIPGPGLAPPPLRETDGQDRFRVGAWPEKGIPGGRLGPNRNGRAW